jgi:hypothetical protein
MAKKKTRKIKIRRPPKSPKPAKRIRIRKIKPPKPARRIRLKRAPKARTRRVKIRRLPKPKTQRSTPRRKIRITKTKGASKGAKKAAREFGKRLGKKIGRQITEAKNPEVTLTPQQWLVSFRYESSGRSVDFLVVAFSAKDALKFVRQELRKTRSGQTMLENFKPRVYQFNPPKYRDLEDVGEVIER